MNESLLLLLFGLSVAWTNEVALQEFVKANNFLLVMFIIRNFKKYEKENFLVSPFSAEIALAFAQSGCEGETAEEIRNSLHLPNSKSKIEDGIKTLLPTMKGTDLYTLHTANKMYLKENFQIKETFKKIATEVYYSKIENIDFTKRNEAAKKMNQWIEQQTENKIKNLIDLNDLDEYTRAVLINALYFKANWSETFDLVYTKKQTFYKTSKETIEVDMMHDRHEEYYKYYECSRLDAKFLEIPFVGGDASMTIILPNDKNGITNLENKTDNVFIPHNLTHELVNVEIPRFKLETKIDLKQILQNMGVNKAFQEGEADLSGIAGNKSDLYINNVVQKTFIDVNEEGAEAEAATYVLVPVLTSAAIYPTPPKQFIAEHPFIFYIKVKDIIIFAGKIVAPYS